jgi:hypothetical protein
MSDMTQYMVKNHTLGHGGQQTVYKFPNGYGASVIVGGIAYGNEDAPYELAVIKFRTDRDGFDLCYDTPITDDVVGHQTGEDIINLLIQIKNL